MPRKSVTFIDPDVSLTTHSIVSYLIDDLDSISDRDFSMLLREMLEQAHLRRVFNVVEEFISTSEYEIY